MAGTKKGGKGSPAKGSAAKGTKKRAMPGLNSLTAEIKTQAQASGNPLGFVAGLMGQLGALLTSLPQQTIQATATKTPTARKTASTRKASSKSAGAAKKTTRRSRHNGHSTGAETSAASAA